LIFTPAKFDWKTDIIFCLLSNNLEEMRDQWERIKLSYEILTDKKTRLRYDRHEVLADPKAAMQRAAMDAVGNGIMGLGKGLFGFGAFAVKSVTDSAKEEK
jgi:DnaJ-class molecular chaperone